MAAEVRAVANGPGSTDTHEEGFVVDKIICITKDAALGGAYNVFSLSEEDSSGQGKPFRLNSHKVHDLPETLREFLIDATPDYLRNSSSRRVHFVVSTGSGTGLALDFYQYVLRPLFAELRSAPGRSESTSDETSDAVTITQDAQSIRRFARDLNVSTKGADGSDVQHTVVLLSGDGGTIELLNGKAPGDNVSTSSASLPLIATFPFGTGNALFHSLHKPFYAIADTNTPGPSPLVLGLRTLLHGQAEPLPSFKVDFSAGSRTIAYTKPENSPGETSGVGSKEQSDAISQLYGAIVASYGLHSQLVWESDTPEFRKHGSKRFQMVAAELMKENHAYSATVETVSSTGDVQSELDRQKHAYILATLVSNLEKAFTISPASQPLDGQLRVVHFGPVPAQKAQEIMMQAYSNGSHIGMEWETEDGKTEQVGYSAVKKIRVTIHEEDPRWRKVCIDGTIVEIPNGGSMTVTTETEPHLQVLVHQAVRRS